jgi:hypothetical protein
MLVEHCNKNTKKVTRMALLKSSAEVLILAGSYLVYYNLVIGKLIASFLLEIKK